MTLEEFQLCLAAGSNLGDKIQDAYLYPLSGLFLINLFFKNLESPGCLEVQLC